MTRLSAAYPFTLPGLSGIKITATKKSVHNMESPASEGPLIGEGDRDADEDTDEEVEEIGEGFVDSKKISGCSHSHEI